MEREGAEPVIVPEIERFGEKNKTTGQQNWEELPPGSALQGLLLPIPPGKDYRLLKSRHAARHRRSNRPPGK